MSLYFILGNPGDGKSYFAVTRIMRALKEHNRNVYTNIPLNPDRLARFIAYKLADNKLYYMDHMRHILKRIHIFRTFKCLKEYRKFASENKEWISTHRMRDRVFDSDVLKSQKLLFPDSLIDEFWEHTKPNCEIYLDETYQYYNALDQSGRDKENLARRKKMQNYIALHRHYKDDLFFLTQDEGHLDRSLLNFCCYRYRCEMSLKKSVIPPRYLEKYPLMLGPLKGCRNFKLFFVISGYIGDKQELDRDFFLPAIQDVFACYDSFSISGRIDKKIDFDDHVKGASSDINVSKIAIMKDWLRSAWIHIIILALVVMAIFGMFRGVYLVLEQSKIPVKSTSASSVPAVSSPVNPSGQGGQDVQKKDKPKITGITSTALYFSDGFILRKGSNYEYKDKSFIVLSVGRDVCSFKHTGSGKIFSVASTGLRD